MFFSPREKVPLVSDEEVRRKEDTDEGEGSKKSIKIDFIPSASNVKMELTVPKAWTKFPNTTKKAGSSASFEVENLFSIRNHAQNKNNNNK